MNIPGSLQQSDVIELDEMLVNLPSDPGLKPWMIDYKPDYSEAIRRHYLQKGIVNLKLTKCQEKLWWRAIDGLSAVGLIYLSGWNIV